MSVSDQSGHSSRDIRQQKHLPEIPFRIAALTQLHPATALMANASREIEMISMKLGGGSGIRTHVTVSRKHAFQACAFSHSATPPDRTFLNAASLCHRKPATPLPQPPFLIGCQRHTLSSGAPSASLFIGLSPAPGGQLKTEKQPHAK